MATVNDLAEKCSRFIKSHGRVVIDRWRDGRLSDMKAVLALYTIHAAAAKKFWADPRTTPKNWYEWAIGPQASFTAFLRTIKSEGGRLCVLTPT